MKKQLLTLFVFLLSITLYSQTAPFNISIVPMNIDGLGGLQSFAFAQHNGKWLIVGGRLDGLHRRQPFAAFDVAGNNNQIIVIDPVLKQKDRILVCMKINGENMQQKKREESNQSVLLEQIIPCIVLPITEEIILIMTDRTVKILKEELDITHTIF